MPVTDVGYMIVKPGVDVMDETSPGGQILTKAWNTVTSEKTGPYTVYWGVEVENPSNFWGFFDFDSVEQHMEFGKEHGVHVVKDFPTIFDKGFTKHFETTPFPPSAFRAPVTEVMLAFFPSDLSADAQATVTGRIAQFADKALTGCPDVHACNYGWGVENDFPVRGGAEGQTGSLFVTLIGWSSVDAHMKFRETDVFKENVGLLRGLEGLLKIDMFHIACKVKENEARKV